MTVSTDGHVAHLWLDRAEARNAMGLAFFADLPAAVAEVSADPEVRAVVVAARGRDFSVGLDLKEMGAVLASGGRSGAPGTRPEATPGPDGPDSTTADGRAPRPSRAAQAAATRLSVKAMQQAITALAECPKPVIAAVHGNCIGGGVDLIAACDIRLASEEAVFSVRETRVAIVADLGTLQRLPRLIAPGHVAELAFTGRDFTAEHAARIGLVNDVLPGVDALHAAAGELAAAIAANPPLAVQGTKAVLAASADRTVADGLDYVATWNAGMLQSADLVEAMMAFAEKRAPRFTGN